MPEAYSIVQVVIIVRSCRCRLVRRSQQCQCHRRLLFDCKAASPSHCQSQVVTVIISVFVVSSYVYWTVAARGIAHFNVNVTCIACTVGRGAAVGADAAEGDAVAEPGAATYLHGCHVICLNMNMHIIMCPLAVVPVCLPLLLPIAMKCFGGSPVYRTASCDIRYHETCAVAFGIHHSRFSQRFLSCLPFCSRLRHLGSCV